MWLTCCGRGGGAGRVSMRCAVAVFAEMQDRYSGHATTELSFSDASDRLVLPRLRLSPMNEQKNSSRRETLRLQKPGNQ